jgi:5-hydroxyisourate hydrolase-like protein (transthyretin family)
MKKKNIKIPVSKTLLVIVAGLMFNVATAQTDSTGQDKKESSIDLSFYKKADLSKTISAVVTTMGENGKWVPAAGVSINFYSQEKSGPVMLKTVVTNARGIAILPFPDSLSKDAQGLYKIIARVENNSLYKDAEETIAFKEANLTLKFNPADSSHEVTAMVTETGNDGKEIPVAETEISFFVQRLFGTMPANEEYVVSTDKDGEAVFSYPGDIKGGRTGKITLVAKILDNKLFGTVETKSDAPWGIVVPVETNPFPRALIMPKAPLQLIITLVLIFGGIWTTYFFIFYQLKKINEEKKVNPVNEIKL